MYGHTTLTWMLFLFLPPLSVDINESCSWAVGKRQKEELVRFEARSAGLGAQAHAVCHVNPYIIHIRYPYPGVLRKVTSEHKNAHAYMYRKLTGD